MSRQTHQGRTRWGVPLIAALLLSGCVVAPIDRYGYEEEVVIVAPAPRIEYRGYPPVAGYIWIDGYWNRVGQRHHWTSGRWSPPPPRYRAPEYSRDRDREHRRDRDDDRRDYRGHDRDGDRDRKRSHDRDRVEVRNPVQQHNHQANTQRRESAREQVQTEASAPTRARDRNGDDRPHRERIAARPSEQSRDRNERNSWRERPRERQQGEAPWRTETR